MVAAVAITDM